MPCTCARVDIERDPVSEQDSEQALLEETQCRLQHERLLQRFKRHVVDVEDAMRRVVPMESELLAEKLVEIETGHEASRVQCTSCLGRARRA